MLHIDVIKSLKMISIVQYRSNNLDAKPREFDKNKQKKLQLR
jgi:hypothetical protein